MENSNMEFAEKLFIIINNPENYNIIRWSDDGQSFLLLDAYKFTDDILLKFFKHKNISSFIRQLNKYGFNKVKPTVEKTKKYGTFFCEYSNDFFIRGREDLLCNIRRKNLRNDKKMDAAEDSTDLAEKCIYTQNKILNSMKTLFSHLQIIVEDIVELKKNFLDRNPVKSSKVLTALVFEENLTLRRFIVGVTQRYGFTVYVAETIIDINALVSSTNFDLIVLSNSLVNVFGLLSEIRRFSLSSLIFVTGFNFSKSDCMEYRRMNVNELLLKSFTKEQWSEIMERYSFTEDNMENMTNNGSSNLG